MSVYLNFCYLDLNIEKEPKRDNIGDNVIFTSSSYEDISTNIIFKTSKFFFANDLFNKLLESTTYGSQDIEMIKFVFGNMFWLENRKLENDNSTFLWNFWNLKWKHYNVLDFYSIHQDDVSKILNVFSKINLELFLNSIDNQKQIDENDIISFKEIITEWISIFEIGVIKNKGIVYDFG
jgi:hypothetical protein